MEACHFWGNSPTGTTAIPVALDKDVVLLRQPFLIVSIWDAEQTRRNFLAGLAEGHSSMVAVNTGCCHSKWGTEKTTSGSPTRNNKSIPYKPQSVLQPQPRKIMCTTVVIQDYNNYGARDNVFLDSCCKQIWMFLLAWKIKHKKKLFIYNSILQETDCQQQFGRASLTSFRNQEEKSSESKCLLKQMKAEALRARATASKFLQRVHLSIWIFCILKETHHMLGWLS